MPIVSSRAVTVRMGIITPLEPYVYALPTRLGACEGGGAALQLQHAWRRWEREACPHEMRDAANATQRLAVAMEGRGFAMPRTVQDPTVHSRLQCIVMPFGNSATRDDDAEITRPAELFPRRGSEVQGSALQAVAPCPLAIRSNGRIFPPGKIAPHCRQTAALDCSCRWL